MEEIIWIGVVILWMIGAAQRAAKRKEQHQAGMDSAASSPTKQKPDWRERILEAAREWENEQRRQEGELPGLPEGMRLEPEEDSPTRSTRRPSVVVHDVTPDRTAVAGGREWRPAAQRPATRDTELEPFGVPVRMEPRSVAPRPAPEVPARATRERARPAPRPTEATRSTRPPRQASAGEDFLARLDHYPPLQRAIVLTEILGKPKGMEEPA